MKGPKEIAAMLNQVQRIGQQERRKREHMEAEKQAKNSHRITLLADSDREGEIL